MSLWRRRCGPGLVADDEDDEDVVEVDVDVDAAAAIAWEGNPGRRWGALVLFDRSIGLPKNRIGGRPEPGQAARGWVKGRKARERNFLVLLC